MNRVVVVAALVASSSGCHGWSKQDTLLELGVEASFIVDERQTQAAVDNPAMGEVNPVIGLRGQNMSPATYFVGVGLLHVAIAAVLPRGWIRTAFQLATVSYEVGLEYRNHEIFEGVRATALAIQEQTH